MVIPEIQHDLLIMRTGEVILRLPKRKEKKYGWRTPIYIYSQQSERDYKNTQSATDRNESLKSSDAC
jgi:hypothetical protein